MIAMEYSGAKVDKIFQIGTFFKYFRLIWSWDEGVKLLHDHDIPQDQKKLQANHIVQFIEQRLIH